MTLLTNGCFGYGWIIDWESWLDGFNGQYLLFIANSESARRRGLLSAAGICEGGACRWLL